MYEAQYVIAIKEPQQGWKYASICYGGSNGCSITPKFKSFNEDIITFDSVEQAEKWWRNNKHRLVYSCPVSSNIYIQKFNSENITETIKKISL